MPLWVVLIVALAVVGTTARDKANADFINQEQAKTLTRTLNEFPDDDPLASQYTLIGQMKAELREYRKGDTYDYNRFFQDYFFRADEALEIYQTQEDEFSQEHLRTGLSFYLSKTSDEDKQELESQIAEFKKERESTTDTLTRVISEIWEKLELYAAE